MNKCASDIAKGIAIIMMLCHHAFYSAETIAKRAAGMSIHYAPFTEGSLVALAQSFKCCVPVFVLITGYGTYRSVSRYIKGSQMPSPGTVTAYCVKRHLRLMASFWPIFFLGIAACTLTTTHTLHAVYGGKGPLVAAYYASLDGLGLAKAFHSPTFNDTWWYLSLAILLIYLVPVLVLVAQRTGSVPLLVIAVVLFLFAPVKMTDTVPRYVPTAIFGMICAQHDLLKREPSGGAGRSLSASLVALAVLGVMLSIMPRLGQAWIFHTVGAFAICKIAVELEHYGGRVLGFLGRHSSNLFMSHTLIMAWLLPRQLYSLGHWAVILAAVLGVSLGFSVVLELAKEKLGYNALASKVIDAIATKTEGTLVQPA